MNTYPLIRTRWSNEHVMAALFLVLTLYHLPYWAKSPSDITGYILLILIALVLDATVGIIRYKCPVCAVSAGVTAAMISVLTQGVPFWGQLLAVVLGLSAGKHLWGGMGRNPVNPAITGILLITPLYTLQYPVFKVTALLIPALILSLPFLKLRPFAGAGFMLGMIAGLYAGGYLTINSITVYGVIFWGCLVLTDPVTVTMKPSAGFLTTFAAGFLSLFFNQSLITVGLGVIGVNLASYILNNLHTKSSYIIKRSLRIKKVAPYCSESITVIDLTEGENTTDNTSEITSLKNACDPLKNIKCELTTEELLRSIRKNDVFGFGGGAFPAFEKITAVLQAKTSNKHFIINGVECDPGLIHDQWIMREHSEEISGGIELICRCVPFSSVTLAVKNTEDLNMAKNIKIHKVPDYYPAGAEKILIKEVLGRKLSDKEIPAVCGILVLNVQTVYSIYKAIYYNEKADTRYITVLDLKERKNKILKVRLGMRIYDIVKSIYPQTVCAFTGGGIMQSRVAGEDDIVEKSTNFIAVGGLPGYKESPQCSRCGACRDSCPSGLEVDKIADMVDCGSVAYTRRYHPDRCISCGSCSYVCLAGRELASRIKKAKLAVKENANA